ncbi:MAG: glycosyltransferase family 4 protein [Chloroflexota bacterium]
MNILLISRCPPYPLHFGDRLIVYHLARQLARRKHVIDLIAFSDRFEDIADRAHYADLFRQITFVSEPPRSSFDYATRLLIPPLRFPNSAERAWSPAMWNAIRQHVGANHYDVAHLFGGIQVYEYAHAVEPLPTVITPYESFSLYLRRVVEYQGEPDEQPSFQERLADRLKARLQWNMARRYESWMFNPYRRVTVVSKRDREELRALNPALPVDVIPNGVDLEYFQPKAQRRDPHTLLFTGNYEYAPNVDAALRLARDIFPQVQLRFPDAKLWLVGNAPPPELQALASQAVAVTGHVPDMRVYLEQASVFVAPLRLGAGIKNKLLEALALRLPVVATPLSIDGIAVEDGEHALIAETDAGMTAAVLRLFEDADLRDQLGANGRRLIEQRYSWAQVAEQYEALFADVAK